MNQLPRRTRIAHEAEPVLPLLSADHPFIDHSSLPDCQRRRRSDYHRERIRNDSYYAEDVRASQKKWSQAHPEYWKQYRQQHLASVMTAHIGHRRCE